MMSKRSGKGDGLLVAVNPEAAETRFATLLGSSGNDVVLMPSRSAEGFVLVVGDAGKGDYPVTRGAAPTKFAGGASDASISKFMQALSFMREVTRESLMACVDALFTHSASFSQKWFELLCDHAERWQSRDISLIRMFIESAIKRNLAFNRARVSRLSCAIFKLLARD